MLSALALAWADVVGHHGKGQRLEITLQEIGHALTVGVAAGWPSLAALDIARKRRLSGFIA